MEENNDKARHGRGFWIRLLAIVLAVSFLGTELFVRYGEGISTSSIAVSKTDQTEAADTSSGGLTITKDGILRMAAAYVEAGDYKSAAEYFGVLIEAGDTDYYRNRAECYYQLADFTGMLNDCKSYLAAGGVDDDGSVNLMMAAAYMKNQQYAEAENALKNSIAAGYSDSKELYLQLVRCNFVLGEYNDVIINADTALSDEAESGVITDSEAQKNAEIKYYRAISYVNLNEYEKARTDLEYVVGNTTDETIKSSAAELLTQVSQALGEA